VTGESVRLEGRLVKVFGGTAWDLLGPDGHAGLEQVYRVFETRYVVLTLEECEEGTIEVAEGTGLEWLSLKAEVVQALRVRDFVTLQDVYEATDAQLLAVRGMGKRTLRRIRDQLGQE